MLVAIRVDASMTIGTGHTYRMLALATALQRNSHQVVFVARTLTGNLFSLISAQFTLIELPAPSQQQVHNRHCHHGDWLQVSYQQEISQCQQALDAFLANHSQDQFDWIIADHYAIDSTWHQAIAEYTRYVMQVDDLADRTHGCDLLLDQNFFQQMPLRYANKLPQKCQLLLGPTFALLREEFAIQRQRLKPYTSRLAQQHVVLFFGGVDTDNETYKALTGLLAAKSNDIFDVIIGQNNPHQTKLNALIQCHPNRIKLHIQISNMMEVFANGYLYVGAVGATTWERCVLGLPGIVCSLALNQRQLAEDLAGINGHTYLGEHKQLTAHDYQLAYEQALNNRQALTLQSQGCAALVSGQGCQQVVDTMAGIFANG